MTLNFAIPPAVRPVFAPAVILVAAVLVAAIGWNLPPELKGLHALGPGLVILLAAAVSLWFNRGRAFIASASLVAAYAAYHFALKLDGGAFAAKAVYTALVVVVPFNILLALALPERGVSHHHNYRWLLLAVIEVLLVAWIAAAGRSGFSGAAWFGVLDHWLLRSPPTPLVGRLMFAAAFVAAVARAWPRHSPLDIGMVGAVVAFFIASEWVGSADAFSIFMTAAGAVLLVSVLQESHRLAFIDELTGLPSRRALEERLRALGPTYTIAMVDVDHFKQFNDAHGHDIGDQVLRLVAARLSEVGGGGKAFRYGGEEFSVLFADQTVKQALPHLEQIRDSIEHYAMEVRSDDRPKDPESGIRRRHAHRPGKTLSVTVSIGVAEKDGKLGTPALVLKASDEALYRAKKGGRNLVSR
jgi:diguanylate cyclase (GGDEF)-like protein